MHDTIITGGQVFDGSGSEPVQADIAIKNGKIVEVGEVGEVGAATQTIDARGAIVTPAWVDIHTHYDGQVTWDDEMNPSASHGVGTIVMGNCGVGFAPVAPGAEKDLIDLMEGVASRLPFAGLVETHPLFV